MEEENSVFINNKELSCLFCGGSKFKKVFVKMNKKWMAIFDSEMFAPEGTAYICKSCGLKHEFFK